MKNKTANELKNERIIRYIITLVHFAASFFYEKLIFDFSEDRSVVLSIAKNNIVSDHFEFVESYIFSKILGLIFIYLLWRIIFLVRSNFNKTILVHTLVFLLGVLLLFVSWPKVFFDCPDNCVTLSYALRFYPEYWHNAYSSFIYAGMMMVFPHPIAITLLQWFFFMATVGYISFRIKENPAFKNQGLYAPYIMIIVPEWFTLVSNAYRTEQYAILCVFYISVLLFDMLEHKDRKPVEIIAIMLLSGIVSVWRSEGVILGFLAFLFALIFAYRKSWKKTAIYMVGFVLVFVMFSMPQKLGDKKYYGKDYSFINSFPTLCNTLNSNNGILKQYEGIEEDLSAIEAVVPINLVRVYGMEGYRRYNYANGRMDINQSLCDADTSARYMKAYYNLVLHNPVVYAKTQISMLLKIAGIKDDVYIEKTYIEGFYNDLPDYHYSGWEIGEADLYKFQLAIDMYNSKPANVLSSIITDTIQEIRIIMKAAYIRTFVIVLLPVAEIVMIIYEFIKLIRKKNSTVGLGALALALLGQALAISLVMPAGVIAYFHPYLYCSVILVTVYSMAFKNRRV